MLSLLLVALIQPPRPPGNEQVPLPRPGHYGAIRPAKALGEKRMRLYEAIAEAWSDKFDIGICSGLGESGDNTWILFPLGRGDRVMFLTRYGMPPGYDWQRNQHATLWELTSYGVLGDRPKLLSFVRLMPRRSGPLLRSKGTLVRFTEKVADSFGFPEDMPKGIRDELDRRDPLAVYMLQRIGGVVSGYVNREGEETLSSGNHRNDGTRWLVTSNELAALRHK